MTTAYEAWLDAVHRCFWERTRQDIFACVPSHELTDLLEEFLKARDPARIALGLTYYARPQLGVVT